MLKRMVRRKLGKKNAPADRDDQRPGPSHPQCFRVAVVVPNDAFDLLDRLCEPR
jgi:hypothetical protein